MVKSHSLADTAKFVRSSLSSAKVPIRPASRIGTMINSLFDETGQPRFVPRKDDAAFLAAKQAYRDLLQIEFILEEFQSQLLDPEVHARLRLLGKDSVDPTADQHSSSRGRDAQCELYFAAVCQKAGLQPEFDERPDIICKFQSNRCGLAVKRLKSMPSLENQIRKAAEQVFQSNMTGIVAMDVTLGTNPDDESMDTVIPSSKIARIVRDRTDKFVYDHMEQFEQWVKHKWVSGIIFTFHDLCAGSASSYTMETSTAGIAASDNQRRRREFLQFFEQFKTGSATDPEQR